MKPKHDLAAEKLTAWTVEASFSLARLGQSHGLVGQDGLSKPGAAAPLQLRVRGDGSIEFRSRAYDASHVAHEVRSKEPVVAGRW